MVCVMMFNGVLISANAETRQGGNSYSSSEVRISDSTIDTYVTNISTKQVDVLRSVRESDGTYSYYGWYDVGNEKDYMNRESDFKTTVTNGAVVYTTNGKASRVVATLDGKDTTNNGNSSRGINGVFPTKWSAMDPDYGNIATDVADAISLASILASVAGVGTPATLMSIASYIIGRNIVTVYYKRTKYVRAYDACTQQYYYVTNWYSNANYTGLINTTKTDIHEDYLC